MNKVTFRGIQALFADPIITQSLSERELLISKINVYLFLLPVLTSPSMLLFYASTTFHQRTPD